MSVIKAIFLPISHELSIDLELEVEISASSLEIIAVHPKSTSTDAQKTSLNVPAECPKCYENISLNVSLFRREHEPVTIKEEKVFLKEEETEVEEFTDCEYYVDYYEQSPEKAPKKTPKTTLKTSRKRKPTKAKRLPSPIEEVEAPPKPEKTCKNCGQNFQTRTKWENHERSCIIDIQCFECSKVFKNKTLYSNHVKAEHDGVWRCHICHVQMDRQRAWLHHMQRGDHDVGKEMVECERCNEVFTQIEFSIHKTDLLKEDVLCQLCHDGKKFHTKTEFKEHVQELHDNDKFACSVCYPVEIMPNLTKFLIHMRYHWNSVKPRCGNCKKNFNSLAERDTHILKCIIENPVVEYECDICTNKYRTKEALKRHVLDYHKHNGKIYQCHECGTTFYRKRSYDTHLLQHEFADRRPFKCDFCKRGFTNKQSMRNHILFIHYPKDLCTVPCDVEGCKEMCYSQEHLTKHRKTHKAKESRVCDVCGKVLSDKHTLLTHLKLVHTVKGSNKKHECDQCNFTTNNAKYLKIHKMQHLPNDKKPFQCKFCGKGFINRSIGIRHEMIHTDARPIVCTTCGKRFRHQGDLKTHMRLHTGDKPYECSVCGKKYGDRGCFRTHLVMHERQLNITLDKSIKKPMLIAGETTQ